MGNNIRGYQIQGDSPLGEGGFGKVYKASKDGKEYAIKKIIIDKYITEQRVLKQIEAMEQLKSKYVVHIFDSFVVAEDNKTDKAAYIVMQKYQCSLDERFKQFHSDSTKMEISKMIIEAVKYIHSKNFSHRDLKMENVLIKNDKVVISDFGLSRNIPSKGEMTTKVGSGYYQAKQILQQKPYTDKVDSWSLGIILFELWTGMRINEVRKGLFPAYWQKFPNLEQMGKIKNDKMKQIVKKLLVQDPDKRLKVSQIFKLFQRYEIENQEQMSPIKIKMKDISQIEFPTQEVKLFVQSQIFIELENYSDED